MLARFILFISIFQLFTANIQAQIQEISAQVLDSLTSEPLAGCEIRFDQTGTITDDQGFFSLAADGDTEVVFQYIGYQRQVIKARNIMASVRLVPRIIQGRSIQVVGALMSAPLLETESSVSVIQARVLEQAAEPQFEKIMQQIPNLSYAGGTSRPRFFQIRGMGERSQYAGDGPPNFSVGFSLDGLDLSGMGMAGLTFDMDHIEVFRGPQSSIYGPNAIAGFISMYSKDADQSRDRTLKLTLGNDAIKNIGVALNLFRSREWGVRLAMYHGRSNGFRRNQYLNREDTNRRNESLVRLKSYWNIGSKLGLRALLLWSDLDNGYDAWAPDNNGYRTYTDKPGKDSQQLTGSVIKLTYDLYPGLSINGILTASQAHMIHSYDSDWGNDEFWAQDPYNFDPAIEGWHYDFFDAIDRNRQTFSQELRARWMSNDGSSSLILGSYFKDLIENDSAEGYLFGGDETELESEFKLRNRSLYGQFEYRLSSQFVLLANARSGFRNTEYSDDKGTEFTLEDQLNGGKFALRYHLGANQTVYASYARGFKAGGVNQHPRILDIHRPYKPEYLNNIEIGYRRFSTRGMLSIQVFLTQREDQQVSLSSQQDPNDPNSFTYYIGNAARGQSQGLEVELKHLFPQELTLSATLGLLKSITDAYAFEVAPGEFVSLGDREYAHAPNYSYRVSLEKGWSDQISTDVSLSGKDAYYFSESHDKQAEASSLLNAGLNLRVWQHADLRVWVENLTDEKIATRGFYFGLEPPDYPSRSYVTYANPRQYGVTLSYHF